MLPSQKLPPVLMSKVVGFIRFPVTSPLPPLLCLLTFFTNTCFPVSVMVLVQGSCRCHFSVHSSLPQSTPSSLLLLSAFLVTTSLFWKMGHALFPQGQHSSCIFSTTKSVMINQYIFELRYTFRQYTVSYPMEKIMCES